MVGGGAGGGSSGEFCPCKCGICGRLRLLFRMLRLLGEDDPDGFCPCPGIVMADPLRGPRCGDGGVARPSAVSPSHLLTIFDCLLTAERHDVGSR